MSSLSDDIPSLLALGNVSVFWRQVSTTEDVWRKLFQSVFHKLEPSDEYFLENGAPKPTLLKEAKTKQGGTLPVGPSSYYHLFATKYPLHQRWMKQQFSSSLILNDKQLDKAFSMMVQWRGFCVTAGSDGAVCLWNPKNFSNTNSSKVASSSSSSTPKPPKLKPFRVFQIHQGHIWWMTIQGDLCFTVGSDGTFKVSNLEPLVASDPLNAVVEQITVLDWNIPIWCIDVNRRSRKVVIGTQDGHVVLMSWKKGNWKQWKALRTVKLRSGIWDVCLLPGRFAVCANIDICIYNFEASEIESSFDAENPPPAPANNALISVNRRAVLTPVDLKLPKEGQEAIPNRPRGGLTRNLNFIDGQLVAACSTVGLEAWDIDTAERLWTLDTRGYDVFDVGMTNNKLVCVGTDEDTGMAAVIVFDGPSRTFVLESGPDQGIGRVFSTCVTDGSIYVCAVNGLYHIDFNPREKGKKDDSSCVIS